MSECSPAQVGAAEISPVAISIAKICIAQVGAPQIGDGEIVAKKQPLPNAAPLRSRQCFKAIAWP